MAQSRETDPSRRDFLLKTAVLGTGLVFGSQLGKTGLASPRPQHPSPSDSGNTPLSESSDGFASIAPAKIQKVVSDSIANMIAVTVRYEDEIHLHFVGLYRGKRIIGYERIDE